MQTIPITYRTRRPDITFHSSGRIEISARASKMLNICEGDIITLRLWHESLCLGVAFQATEAVGRHRGICRRTSSSLNHYRTYSRALCRAAMHSAGALQASAVGLYGADPLLHPAYGILLPLLTQTPVKY